MADEKQKAPRDIPYDDLVAVVEAIRDTLWPGGDPEHVWSGADDLQSIAGILEDNGLAPK